MKTIIPEAGSTFSSLHHNDTLSLSVDWGLDEPELGLHPAAITYLAELLRTRAQECQILAATQSVTLVNQLDPDNVWVTDRKDGESTFKHLADENLDPWLEAYAIGDIWEKNLIGGRP